MRICNSKYREYLLLVGFLAGLSIGHVTHANLRPFSVAVNIFIDWFVFLSPAIVFIILFCSACSLISETELAGPIIKNAAILFAVLMLACALFASAALSPLLPSGTVSKEFSMGTLSYLMHVVLGSMVRPLTISLLIGAVSPFLLSRTSSFGRIVKLSRVIYKLQERVFGMLMKVFPLVTFSLGATLYYQLGIVSVRAYVISMILTLGLGLLALIALAVLVKTYADVGLGALCKYSVRLFSSGLAIGSSYLILPIALKVFKEHFSIRRDVADLGLALGTSLNRCGSVMGVLVVSYVAARFTGTYFSSADMFLMAVPVALVAFGSPGVQGGTLFVTMSLILDVIAPSDVNKFTGVAFAIFIGGTTFIQAAVNTVASSYVTLLIGYGKRL